jgi:hypothetical protein
MTSLGSGSTRSSFTEYESNCDSDSSVHSWVSVTPRRSSCGPTNAPPIRCIWEDRKSISPPTIPAPETANSLPSMVSVPSLDYTAPYSAPPTVAQGGIDWGKERPFPQTARSNDQDAPARVSSSGSMDGWRPSARAVSPISKLSGGKPPFYDRAPSRGLTTALPIASGLLAVGFVLLASIFPTS